MKKTILITGGAGFIGSHTCIELIDNGYNIIVFDNFENSNIDSILRIKKICKKQNNNFSKNFKYVVGDIKNENALSKVFEESFCKNQKWERGKAGGN